MKPYEIVRQIIDDSERTQNSIARELGLSNQSFSTRFTNNTDTLLGNYIDVLSVLGYELVVIPKGAEQMPMDQECYDEVMARLNDLLWVLRDDDVKKSTLDCICNLMGAIIRANPMHDKKVDGSLRFGNITAFIVERPQKSSKKGA